MFDTVAPMPDEDDEPTQTTPTGEVRAEYIGRRDASGALVVDEHGGHTIPVPEREDVLAALLKVAHANGAASPDDETAPN